MTRKLPPLKRSLSGSVTRRASDIAALEERADRERRELHGLMDVAGGALRCADRERGTDVEKTRAALLRAAWVAHHRAAAGAEDPHLVDLRVALDRYLATRTDSERGWREIPPLKGPKGGQQRAAAVRVLLTEHVVPFVQRLKAENARCDDEQARKWVGVLASALIVRALSTGLGTHPTKEADADDFREKVFLNLRLEKLTTINALSGVLQAIGHDREEADQLTKRAHDAPARRRASR
jgi:hypothetical protein